MTIMLMTMMMIMVSPKPSSNDNDAGGDNEDEDVAHGKYSNKHRVHRSNLHPIGRFYNILFLLLVLLLLITIQLGNFY